jgi:hypothetical protein
MIDMFLFESNLSVFTDKLKLMIPTEGEVKLKWLTPWVYKCEMMCKKVMYYNTVFLEAFFLIVKNWKQLEKIEWGSHRTESGKSGADDSGLRPHGWDWEVMAAQGGNPWPPISINSGVVHATVLLFSDSHCCWDDGHAPPSWWLRLGIVVQAGLEQKKKKKKKSKTPVSKITRVKRAEV